MKIYNHILNIQRTANICFIPLKFQLTIQLKKVYFSLLVLIIIILKINALLGQSQVESNILAKQKLGRTKIFYKHFYHIFARAREKITLKLQVRPLFVLIIIQCKQIWQPESLLWHAWLIKLQQQCPSQLQPVHTTENTDFLQDQRRHFLNFFILKTQRIYHQGGESSST